MKSLSSKYIHYSRVLKWLMRFLQISILVALILCGCRPTSEESIQTSPIFLPDGTAVSSANHVKEWLTGQPCKPPCFLGITPGLSPPEEVLSLLRKNPNVTEINDSYSDAKSIDTLTNLRWRWSSSPSPIKGHWDGTIDFDNTSHRPFYIGVSFPEELTLKQAIEAYGEPSHVFAGTFHGVDTPTVPEYDLQLIWLEQGFALGWRYGLTKPIISPEASSYYLFFFEPSLEGYNATWQYSGRYPKPLDQVTAWRGMLEFSEYCTTCTQ